MIALSDPVRLLIVSDIRLHRECFADSLAAFDRIAIVGQAGSPAEALQLAKATLPEVILIDVATEYCLDIVRSAQPRGGHEDSRLRCP